jgi:flavoprotein
MRVLWCITGAGHFLTESVGEIEEVSRKHEVSILFSNAGEEVAKAYGVYNRLCRLYPVIDEKKQGYSTPISGSSRFDVAVVAPCTANTCAKIVHGIADSAVTNVVSQFLKRRLPVVILPTDCKRDVDSVLPNGRSVKVHCRSVDVKNTKSLSRTTGIKVVTSAASIRRFLS